MNITTEHLIEELGGSAKVASALGIAPNTVGNWRKRDIPAWARPFLSRLCEERGIDAGELLELRPPERSRARKAA